MERQQGATAANASLSPPTLSPAIPPYVKLGLTLAYTVFYSVLFAFIYAQLWLVLRYRHKRFSYQTAFLFLCLLWAALRALLFSFYFRDCVTANALGPFCFWLLYCFPVCLQFFTLSLMNLYCAQVFFKAKSKFSPHLLKYKFPLYLLFVGVSLLFLLVNLTCALLVKMTDAQVKTIVLVRVTINDSLFVLCAVSLAVCLYKVAKMSLASIYLESKGTSVCQVTLIGLTVIFLYASRACYNLVVLALTDIQTINSFDYDWYNVSDQVGGARLSRSRVHADVEPLLSVLPQADLRSSLGDAGYVVFGVILFVWELLPTSLVVFFFRVRRPAQERSGSAIPSHVFSNRPYFFDNPRRYDSDDDLAWPSHPVTSSTSLSTDWSSSSFLVHLGGDDQRSPLATAALNR
ncbi:G protein-coupled receptor 137Ba isoform X1 [Megalobrama amblycephala]|uniref:G protein-coupled receptor 137Ba isoform X1 n=1 Tax=Megalobrama amblycephala TaxID=75352 RepID=UPI002013FD82|nr:G protein-coupled receptor 137Ba isoform X1 [Megalobrama amblycephala]XP_048028635.1 G protein-coupled receptor 137Ba isoform X1 [Megalobrama amblycephala]XP_048028636.1 G protein-coupled receptor 137Ba isoform X1 [Megalobrama amblycephala]XP_048028637.1 G protein-coupled receptor 137Ba isoform X1 [Megalobrama amblycephala]